MTDLHVKVTPYNGPLCETGQHVRHPDETCEERDAWLAWWDGFSQQLLEAAMQYAVNGEGTGSPKGIASWIVPKEEPTPIERALDILRPHLTAVPLYRP